MPTPLQRKEPIPAWIDITGSYARKLGSLVDRAGDFSMATLGTVGRNPAAALAIATVLLFTTVRLPLQIFYARFGVRPEEVGFNSVQVLLQGSTVTLVFLVLLTLLLVLTVPLLAIAVSLCHSLLAERWPSRGPRRTTWELTRRNLRRVGRLMPVVMPILSFLVAITYLTNLSIRASDYVQSGNWLRGDLAPWRAEPVKLTWTMDRHPLNLPHSCGSLLYLGEDDARVVLYDSKHGSTHRINARDVELKFPADC
jgi:hypothetical protein